MAQNEAIVSKKKAPSAQGKRRANTCSSSDYMIKLIVQIELNFLHFTQIHAYLSLHQKL